MKKILIIIFPVLLFLLVGCASQEQIDYSKIKNIDSNTGTNLICFGNSLTEGQGAPKGKDYPSLLRAKLDIPIVNAGRGGDTTDKALNRLDKILEMDPKIVIVEFGANDFLISFQGGWGEADVSHKKVFKNLKIIVGKIQDAGAVVVVAGVKINAKYDKGYKKLAKETRSVLIPDILDGIYSDQNLMSPDNRHPNTQGYQKMAGIFLEALEPLLEEMEK